MELDEIRQETIALFEAITPKMQEGVFSPDQFRVHFETPYRARTLKKLEAYERAHKKIFCRSCIQKHPTKSYLLCYQLWVEESDNLLENKPGEWISLQCMNENCDFDLITPRPTKRVKYPELNQRQLQETIKQMQQKDLLSRQYEMSRELREQYQKLVDQQLEKTGQANVFEQELHNHALDALRYYSPAGQAQALRDRYHQPLQPAKKMAPPPKRK